MTNKPAVTVRRACPEDGPAISRLVDALADYEHLERPSAEARARILEHCFAPQPLIEIWLAFVEGVEGPIAYSVICQLYSSFLAKPTLFMEDLFVLPDHRGVGAGFALFKNNVELARARSCGRMEWQCLAWNKLARDFYEKSGAQTMDAWVSYRLTEDKFGDLLD